MGFESVGRASSRKRQLQEPISRPTLFRGTHSRHGSSGRYWWRARADSVGEFGRPRWRYHVGFLLRAGRACLRRHWAEVIWVAVLDFYANSCLAPWSGCRFGDTETLGHQGTNSSVGIKDGCPSVGAKGRRRRLGWPDGVYFLGYTTFPVSGFPVCDIFIGKIHPWHF